MSKIGASNVEITAETQIKRTESPEKVRNAVFNLFGSKGELRVESDKVQFVSNDLESLRFLKEQFRDRRVRTAVRRLLLSNKVKESDQTHLLLNKQAATVKIAAVCDEPRESSLGPIVLRIRSERLDEVIDWLVEGYERS